MKKQKSDSSTKSIKSINAFIDILASPHTGEPLTLQNNSLVTTSGKTYPIVNGVPVLVLEAEPMHVTPPEESKISQTADGYTVPKKYAKAKRVLHLGSGNVPTRDPRVVSLDILPCSQVDVVGEAEHLPFQDESFDFVDSVAVFEHVYDPIAAVKEAKRVLKPGGILRINNSFYQPYHGFPGHYYAMTPQANETYLVDDFTLLESYIPEDGTAMMSLSMTLERFIANLSEAQKKEYLEMSVSNFLSYVKKDVSSKSDLMKNYSTYEARSMAATHVVTAQKPANYEPGTITEDPLVHDNWQRLKREYYTLRTELMLRHHEIFLYKRFALEINPGLTISRVSFPKPIESILKAYIVKNPLSFKELQKTIKSMRKKEKTLRDIRDKIIVIYLSEKAKQDTA